MSGAPPSPPVTPDPSRKKGGGGKARPRHQVQVTEAEVEILMLNCFGRTYISDALKMPVRTIDDYMVKIRQRWAEEAPANREETRRRQVHRLQSKLREAYDAMRFEDAHRIEKLLAKLEGNENDPELINAQVEARLAQIMEVARARLATANGAAQVATASAALKELTGAPAATAAKTD